MTAHTRTAVFKAIVSLGLVTQLACCILVGHANEPLHLACHADSIQEPGNVEDGRAPRSDVSREVTLTSRSLATALTMTDDPQAREITSIQFSGYLLANGGGLGTLRLQTTSLRFNSFGDAVPVGPQQSDDLSVMIETSGLEVPPGNDRRDVFELLTEQPFPYKLYLIVARAESDESRLVMAQHSLAKYIIPLKSPAAKSAAPKELQPGKFDLTSEIFHSTRGFMKLRIEADLGGESKFYLNPNRQERTVTGDVGLSTLLGWGPRTVVLQRQSDKDPVDAGRELYEIVNDTPRLIRYFLVISNSDNEHRLVIRRRDKVIHVLPMRPT